MRGGVNVAVEALGLEAGWLGMMPRAARQKLLSLATRVSFEAGSDIVREGERADRLGIVLAGRAALQLQAGERGRITVETAEAGDVFGLSAIVPPHRATTSVTAQGPVEALIIDPDVLRAAFAEDCELTASVYFAVARALLRRLTAAHDALLDVFGAPRSTGPLGTRSTPQTTPPAA